MGTSRKRKDPPSPPKGNVKETKAKFEEIQNKYRNQTKGKFKRTCKKTQPEVIEHPIAKMMRKMMSDLAEIKTDVKLNNTKIDGLSSKVAQIENKTNETDLKLADLSSKIESIESTSNQSDLRNSKAIKDLKDEITTIESRVTSKLLSEMEPSIGAVKDQIQESLGADLKRLVREEMASQKPPPSEHES